MTDLDDQLAGAFERLADDAPHRPDLAGAVRHRVRRRRAQIGTGLAAACAAVAVAGFLVLPGESQHGLRDTAVVPAAPTCPNAVPKAVLPEWARDGFTDPEPVMPFLSSGSGNLVAILFGDKLTALPRPEAANKVLWVWRELPASPTDIHMSARLGGTGPTLTTGLPSPVGPSYVTLPSAGCWRLTLTWPGGSDTIDLGVEKPMTSLRFTGTDLPRKSVAADRPGVVPSASPKLSSVEVRHGPQP